MKLENILECITSKLCDQHRANCAAKIGDLYFKGSLGQKDYDMVTLYMNKALEIYEDALTLRNLGGVFV